MLIIGFIVNSPPPTRGRLRERIIESPGVFTLSVDMDGERASESGQFSSAGNWGQPSRSDLLQRRRCLHHGGAVREGEAAPTAVAVAMRLTT